MNLGGKPPCWLQKNTCCVCHQHSATKNKKQHVRRSTFTTFAEASQGKRAEHLLLGKLATFLPQDVVFWRFENTWPFTCCSTLELRAFSTAVLYLHDTQSIITCNINSSCASMHLPSHLGTASSTLQNPGGFSEPMAIKSPLWKRLQSRIHPTLQQHQLQPRDTSTPERRCGGTHSPGAPGRARRKWKCWNKHFGTASWLG